MVCPFAVLSKKILPLLWAMPFLFPGPLLAGAPPELVNCEVPYAGLEWPPPADKSGWAQELRKYDPKTWGEFLQELATGKLEWDRSYASIVAELPDPLRAKMLHDIGALYEGLTKKIRRPEEINDETYYLNNFFILPKASLDSFIKAALNPQKMISDLIAKGATSFEAYKRYIETIANLRPQGAKWGVVSAEDILESARIFQRQMNAVAQELKVNDSVAYWFGSFPNGRANLKKSDIDMSLKYAQVQGMNVVFGKVPAETKWTDHKKAGMRLINNYLGSRYPGTNLTMESAGNLSWFESTGYFGRRNGVAFRITSNKIELLVYPEFLPGVQELKPEAFVLDELPLR